MIVLNIEESIFGRSFFRQTARRLSVGYALECSSYGVLYVAL